MSTNLAATQSTWMHLWVRPRQKLHGVTESTSLVQYIGRLSLPAHFSGRTLQVHQYHTTSARSFIGCAFRSPEDTCTPAIWLYLYPTSGRKGRLYFHRLYEQYRPSLQQLHLTWLARSVLHAQDSVEEASWKSKLLNTSLNAVGNASYDPVRGPCRIGHERSNSNQENGDVCSTCGSF